MGSDLDGIGIRIAIFDQDVAADRPSEFPEPLAEILKITLCVRIVLGAPHQYRDPPHPGHRLLRARREGAHDRRAAEKGDELTLLPSCALSANNGHSRRSSCVLASDCNKLASDLRPGCWSGFFVPSQFGE